MKFIAHRINTIEDLVKVPASYGVEVDLRDRDECLILQHDPFKDGDDFEEYLKHYRHGTMILNIKSEGIEFVVLDMIKKYRVRDYFFLDSSFPMLYKLNKKNEKNIAVRLSEFEPLDAVMAMAGRASWVWVDCFTRLALDRKNYKTLKEHRFKLCLVSPELQGREGDILKYGKALKKEGIIPDAICTKLKNITKWSAAI